MTRRHERASVEICSDRRGDVIAVLYGVFTIVCLFVYMPNRALQAAVQEGKKRRRACAMGGARK